LAGCLGVVGGPYWSLRDFRGVFSPALLRLVIASPRNPAQQAGCAEKRFRASDGQGKNPARDQPAEQFDIPGKIAESLRSSHPTESSPAKFDNRAQAFGHGREERIFLLGLSTSKRVTKNQFSQTKIMPRKNTLERVRRAKEEGKAPSTQASEFVREEIENIREGKHGARSAQQAIAIGLSKARRAGVKFPPPKKGTVPEETRRQAEREYEAAQTGRRPSPSPRRSRATTKALRRETGEAASKEALSWQARSVAARRSPAEKTLSAKKAAQTRAKNKLSRSR
jgi:hypothetical protein